MQCGFEKSLSEATVYTKTRGDRDILIVSIYVDDIVYTRSCKELLDEFKEEMMMKYEMIDLGLLHHFLGMGVVQTNSSIFIHQKKQLKSCLRMMEVEHQVNNKIEAFLLARFMHCPTSKHYGTAKHVLRYIKGTLDYGLECVKGKNAMLIGFYDSDWGGSVDDSKIMWHCPLAVAFSLGLQLSRIMWHCPQH
ncbi:unnamed protein product [Prunus armeniaca]